MGAVRCNLGVAVLLISMRDIAHRSMLKLDLRLVSGIAQQLQSNISDLAMLSEVCKDTRSAVLPLLAYLHNHVWHSSNLDLYNWLVWAGEPQRWMNSRNSAGASSNLGRSSGVLRPIASIAHSMPQGEWPKVRAQLGRTDPPQRE